MQREKIFCETIFSEVSNRKCSVNMETLPSGKIELHGHIYIKDEGDYCEKLYCSATGNVVEIAAVRVSIENWMAECQLLPIPNYFARFRNDNIVPVQMWKPDWSIIHVKMEDFMLVIDELFGDMF